MELDYQAALINVSLLWMLTAPHEFAHAWVATRLGDDTPRREGRVTLNPMAHVDWVGTVLLPAATSLLGFGFLGWGKSVNTNVARLRGGLNGLVMVALAGPFSNILFAVVLTAVALLAASTMPAVSSFAYQGVFLSFYLAIFNLLPVPPLDGSKLLLAMRIPSHIYAEIARFGFLALIVLFMRTGLGAWMGNLSASMTVGLFSLMR